MPASGLVIVNLGDGSFVFAPSAEYNVAQNIYLAAGAYLGFGDGPRLEAGAIPESRPVPRSEFGAYPDLIFGSFRVYF